ncbi:hypothetical protein KSP24_25005 [Paenibacillus sp. AK121]|nr:MULTISPECIES: hypothetical protein [Bacteria]MBU9710135.1 hypothetical protein [Paenibacillus sp. AK121]MCW1920852.1 hypothetical protein [Rhodobacter sp. KR11]
MLKTAANWLVVGGIVCVALMTVANGVTDLVLGAVMVGLIYVGAKIDPEA